MDRNIRLLADRWSFDPELMDGTLDAHTTYGLTLARRGEAGGYAGEVDALSLTGPGRWGNYVFQLINMVFVARHVGARTIYVHPTPLVPLAPGTVIGGIAVKPVSEEPPDGVETRLRGVFFNQLPFGRAASALTPAARSDIARRAVRPLMPALRTRDDLVGPDDVLIHIRSGDIFEGEPGDGAHRSGGGNYPQPPLAFYLFALERARREGGGRVVILAENAANPVILQLVTALDRRGIPLVLRLNQSLEEDLGLMLAARQAILANGTIGIAAALMSDRLTDAYFFGHLNTGSKNPVELYLGAPLRTHFALGREPYIARGEWRNTAAQRELMGTYPAQALSWEA